MLQRIILIISVALAVVVPATASATPGYDRRPISLSGLTPDEWGQSITGAERRLYRKYAGISFVQCRGVIILGFEDESSFVHGMTRYWDKNFCVGQTRNGRGFAVVNDAKSATSAIIYRLRGASIHDLQSPGWNSRSNSLSRLGDLRFEKGGIPLAPVE